MFKRALCILSSALLILTSTPLDVLAAAVPSQTEIVEEMNTEVVEEQSEEKETVESAEEEVGATVVHDANEKTAEDEKTDIKSEVIVSPAYASEYGNQIDVEIIADTLKIQVFGDGWLFAPKTVLKLIESQGYTAVYDERMADKKEKGDKDWDSETFFAGELDDLNADWNWTIGPISECALVGENGDIVGSIYPTYEQRVKIKEKINAGAYSYNEKKIVDIVNGASNCAFNAYNVDDTADNTIVLKEVYVEKNEEILKARIIIPYETFMEKKIVPGCDKLSYCCNNSELWIFPTNENDEIVLTEGAVDAIIKDMDANPDEIYIIHISEGIIAIGDKAFGGNKLGSYVVDLPKSLKSIGNFAFADSRVSDITIPENVEMIGEHAFEDCYRLQNVNLSKSLKSIENFAFAGSGVESVFIPENVEMIGENAFAGCYRLQSVILSKKIKWIYDETFKDCTILTSIWTAGAAGIELDGIGYRAFQNCKKLNNVNLLEGLRHIGDSAFSGCDGLQTIKIPATVSSNEGGFHGLGANALPCEDNGNIKVKTINYGGSRYEWNYLLAGQRKIEDDKLGIKSNYSNTNIVYHPAGKYNFEYDEETQTLTLKCNPVKGAVEFDLPDFALSSREYLTEYADVKTLVIEEGVTRIGSNDFGNMKMLKAVKLPSTIKEIDINAFGYVYHRPAITFEYSGTKAQWEQVFSGGVGKHDQVNYAASPLEASGKLDNGISYTYSKTSGVITFSGAMDKPLGSEAGELILSQPEAVQKTIKKVVIKNCHIIGQNAFAGCKYVESFDLLTSGVTKICSGAFADCGFNEISLPISVKEIEADAFTKPIDYQAKIVYAGTKEQWKAIGVEVKYCVYYNGGTKVKLSYNADTKTLNIVGTGDMPDLARTMYIGDNIRNIDVEKVVISEGIISIGENTFSNFLELKEVVIPKSVKTIGKKAFFCCLKLNNVVIPDGVTVIEDMTFDTCRSLKNITIPSSVESIGKDAFADSLSGATVSIPMLKYLGENAFMHYDFEPGPAVINYAGSNLDANVTRELEAHASKVNYEYVAAGLLAENVRYCVKDATMYISGGNADSWNEILGSKNNIKKIVIESGIKVIPEAVFANYTELNEIVLADSVTHIGNKAFANCTKLEKIVLPKNVAYVGDNVEDNTYAFTGCTPVYIEYKGTTQSVIDALKKYSTCPIFAGNVDSVGLNNGLIYAIKGDTITIAGEEKEAGKTTINEVVKKNTAIKKVVFDDDMKVIPDGILDGCVAITSIKLPANCTQIGKNAFKGLKALTTIDIPVSIVKIDTDAFSGCTALKTVNYPGTDAQWKRIIINDATINSINRVDKIKTIQIHYDEYDDVIVGIDGKLLQPTITRDIENGVFDAYEVEVGTLVTITATPKDKYIIKSAGIYNLDHNKKVTSITTKQTGFTYSYVVKDSGCIDVETDYIYSAVVSDDLEPMTALKDGYHFQLGKIYDLDVFMGDEWCNEIARVIVKSGSKDVSSDFVVRGADNAISLAVKDSALAGTYTVEVSETEVVPGKKLTFKFVVEPKIKEGGFKVAGTKAVKVKEIVDGKEVQVSYDTLTQNFDTTVAYKFTTTPANATIDNLQAKLYYYNGESSAWVADVDGKVELDTENKTIKYSAPIGIIGMRKIVVEDVDNGVARKIKDVCVNVVKPAIAAPGASVKSATHKDITISVAKNNALGELNSGRYFIKYVFKGKECPFKGGEQLADGTYVLETTREIRADETWPVIETLELFEGDNVGKHKFDVEVYWTHNFLPGTDNFEVNTSAVKKLANQTTKPMAYATSFSYKTKKNVTYVKSGEKGVSDLLMAQVNFPAAITFPYIQNGESVQSEEYAPKIEMLNGSKVVEVHPELQDTLPVFKVENNTDLYITTNANTAPGTYQFTAYSWTEDGMAPVKASFKFTVKEGDIDYTLTPAMTRVYKKLNAAVNVKVNIKKPAGASGKITWSYIPCDADGIAVEDEAVISRIDRFVKINTSGTISIDKNYIAPMTGCDYVKAMVVATDYRGDVVTAESEPIEISTEMLKIGNVTLGGYADNSSILAETFDLNLEVYDTNGNLISPDDYTVTINNKNALVFEDGTYWTNQVANVNVTVKTKDGGNNTKKVTYKIVYDTIKDGSKYSLDYYSVDGDYKEITDSETTVNTNNNAWINIYPLYEDSNEDIWWLDGKGRYNVTVSVTNATKQTVKNDGMTHTYYKFQFDSKGVAKPMKVTLTDASVKNGLKKTFAINTTYKVPVGKKIKAVQKTALYSGLYSGKQVVEFELSDADLKKGVISDADKLMLSTDVTKYGDANYLYFIDTGLGREGDNTLGVVVDNNMHNDVVVYDAANKKLKITFENSELKNGNYPIQIAAVKGDEIISEFLTVNVKVTSPTVVAGTYKFANTYTMNLDEVVPSASLKGQYIPKKATDSADIIDEEEITSISDKVISYRGNGFTKYFERVKKDGVWYLQVKTNPATGVAYTPSEIGSANTGYVTYRVSYGHNADGTPAKIETKTVAVTVKFAEVHTVAKAQAAIDEYFAGDKFVISNDIYYSQKYADAEKQISPQVTNAIKARFGTDASKYKVEYVKKDVHWYETLYGPTSDEYGKGIIYLRVTSNETKEVKEFATYVKLAKLDLSKQTYKQACYSAATVYLVLLNKAYTDWTSIPKNDAEFYSFADKIINTAKYPVEIALDREYSAGFDYNADAKNMNVEFHVFDSAAKTKNESGYTYKDLFGVNSNYPVDVFTAYVEGPQPVVMVDFVGTGYDIGSEVSVYEFNSVTGVNDIYEANNGEYIHGNRSKGASDDITFKISTEKVRGYTVIAVIEYYDSLICNIYRKQVDVVKDGDIYRISGESLGLYPDLRSISVETVKE